ncbi:TPA: hypothetical protein ACMUZ3_003731 [Clostridioides difficile]|jgi:hypothetical protein|uniref:Uncharacterized protein n=1 Tax=Clostridioides difficile NAP08 TaxID=525259 RepID=D5Q4E3_CLODI|nr:hypothetical protein [Clostridioides difficile]EFH07243.1 hypothetical protein HMPREF0220_1775 [Clostridioides difficile NAP08]MCI4785941.1 hypothetical protein [Clostridioides difficile]MDL0212728.1 hypothetical protein [Clostridioides difficile]MDL0265745.1 hypothetical protein [Clostridioides difficile]MDL0360872.1 hypothetical protein [Clostridioides difficile]
MVGIKIAVRCRADCQAGCRSGCRAESENSLILWGFSFSDNNDNRNIKEKVNSKKIDKPD